MCTLTWLKDREGLRIYFNRDEKRTRLPAAPPRISVINGIRVLAPVDGNAGGTWLAVNEHGVAVAILNYYEAEADGAHSNGNYESRGHLVLRLASQPEASAAIDALRSLPHDAYRPFIVAIFSINHEGMMARWDGRRCTEIGLDSISLPVTTSSYRTNDVLASRTEQYHAMLAGRPVSDDLLAAFHKSRSGKGGPFSVTMTRPDACTVCFNAVMIGDKMISFFYEDRDVAGDDPGYRSGVTVTMTRT